VIAVGARDLFDAYQEDEEEADKLFKDKILEVTGPVAWSRSVFGEYYIVFGGGGLLMSAWGVQCAMKDKTDPRLLKIKKKDLVKVRGRCEGFKMDVILKECVLVD
jgi:hypothetical protein